MTENETRYEHGATKYPAKKDADASDQFSQEAAGNKKPAGGMGLTRSRDEVEDKTHQSEGKIRPDSPPPVPRQKRRPAPGHRSPSVPRMPRLRRAAASQAPTSRTDRPGNLQSAHHRLQRLLSEVRLDLLAARRLPQRCAHVLAIFVRHARR